MSALGSLIEAYMNPTRRTKGRGNCQSSKVLTSTVICLRCSRFIATESNARTETKRVQSIFRHPRETAMRAPLPASAEEQERP